VRKDSINLLWIPIVNRVGGIATPIRYIGTSMPNRATGTKMGLKATTINGLPQLALTRTLFRALLAALVCLLTLPVFAAAEAQPITGRDFKMAGDATKIRIVVNFDREPNPRWMLLRTPNRIVIDFPDTR